MGRPEELLQEEDAGWEELRSLVEPLSREQMEDPTLSPDGWSVKDLLWHIGCWHAECARTLERIRMGTYEVTDYEIDRLNEEFLEESRRLDLATVKTEFTAARTRVLQEWAALAEVTPDAEEWFEESGPQHYRDHLPELRAFVERLGSGG